MKKLISTLCVIGAAAAFGAEKYEPTWESLQKHESAPEWLKDAKLGIYFHWGPYSVPAFANEWYPSQMHLKGNKVHKHHLENYGDPSKFGYHDFIPQFTAEHFDPDEWAELFHKAGARFAGPVAEHHDGYSMWDSKITPWNAKETGPKRDILGDLFKALEKRDMKTIATFHHARNLQRPRSEWEDKGRSGGSHYTYNKDWPTSSEDPKLRLLYGNVPEKEWHENIWLGKLEEVIDTYHPDIIWFDSWLDRIPESYLQRFAAHYLNSAEKWDKEVVIIRKQDDMPLNFTMNDHEKSRAPKALPDLWMTDDTISTGSWCYTKSLKIKPLHKVVHALVDTVSKNGVVLLNLSPKADGTIPADQQEVLLGLGKWLETHGEGIYNTRPWTIASEGPTTEPSGGFGDHAKFSAIEYSAKDIRYTATKDGKTIYAFLLGTPETDSEITMTAFADAKISKVTSVELIGGGKVESSMSDKGLVLTAPGIPKDKASTSAFKISL